MTSRVAQLFLLAAVAYAFFTSGEAWISANQMMDAYMPSQEKIFYVSSAIARWAVDPIFLCGTAAMIEFLERIWRELSKANVKPDAGK
jgi:hypothetical protein